MSIYQDQRGECCVTDIVARKVECGRTQEIRTAFLRVVTLSATLNLFCFGASAANHSGTHAPKFGTAHHVRLSATPIVVRGRLSKAESRICYVFDGASNSLLSWRYEGPAVRIVLVDPTGNTEGPGLAPRVAITLRGKYSFCLASNTMADDIFGRFKLSLKLEQHKHRSKV